ncbi:glycosyltransferase [Desulfofalx alkaliphila]|uniref:glycosyltransferase n=1 Tax=Desulfofalx alkaliphila TaxID=105483 RepID=UPI0004E206AB|nr:glycosyltransferase [Desulfofalx alkaliphila]
MKVLIVSRGYPTEKYKMNGIFEFDQVKALVKAGVEVVYAVIDVRSIRRWRKWGYESFVKEGVQIEAINIPCGRIPNYILNKIKKAALNRLYKKIVNKYGEPDIIHSHFIGMGYITAELFKNSGIPLIHTEHFSGMNQDELSGYHQDIGNNTYIYMKKVITVSNYLADNLKNKFGVASIVIPNIVDTSNFRYKPFNKFYDTFNFISVGNLLANKRMVLLIKSFYDAFKGKKKIKLYIYGEGPERKTLETLIKKLDLANQVFLEGLVDRKTIAKKMQESHCFVLASKLETFGVAYIEAMATGLPVIATKCGGPEMFINDKNGLLIEVDNKIELTEAMKYMKQQSGKYNRKSIATEIKEKFSSEVVGGKIIREYRRIL